MKVVLKYVSNDETVIQTICWLLSLNKILKWFAYIYDSHYKDLIRPCMTQSHGKKSATKTKASLAGLVQVAPTV